MTTAQREIPQEEIARRAYEIWQSRGCPDSDGSEDWETARSQLIQERIARNGSTRERLQSWWSRVRQKAAGQ
jgi:hypothetical protein